MLRSLKDMELYAVRATDGDIGSVADFLLDDERWIIRYLIVETSMFFNGRRVLISPISFGQAEWLTHHFHVTLTMDQVKHSPHIDVDKPVCRQHEQDYYRYYGYSYYWEYPGLLVSDQVNEAFAEPCPGESDDVHLRSAREVRGYHIEGSDEAVGHVEDFIVDDETWEVRYLVIDTSNWWFGTKVLVAPKWAKHISWSEEKVYIDMSRQAIKNSPKWDASAPINREYEARLYDYYGRPIDWSSEVRPSHQSRSHPQG